MARAIKALCVASGLAVTAGWACAQSAPSALEVWHRSLRAQRFQDLRTVGTLTTRFPGGDELTLRVQLLAMMQADGVSRMGVTRVLSGNALVGSAFLNVEHAGAPDDLWVYLPAVGTPRRLVASNLGDSYLGSEFRYGDLVQREPESYRVTSLPDADVSEERCDVIEIVPDARTARDTGLSREVMWIRKSTFVERKVEQYDRQGRLLKEMELEDLFIDAATGKAFPRERRIRNVQSGATSTARFEDVRVNAGLPADTFNPARLSDRPS
jgi:hypothetical protein